MSTTCQVIGIQRNSEHYSIHNGTVWSKIFFNAKQVICYQKMYNNLQQKSFVVHLNTELKYINVNVKLDQPQTEKKQIQM